MTIKDPKFLITEDILDRCIKFAQDSVGTNTDRYARRNQFNPVKIKDDIKSGKLAEEVVYGKLSELYPNLTKPDYTIYSKKDKSWEPDLKDTTSQLRVAVKSQDLKSEVAYGSSWVFQYGDGKRDCDTGIFGKVIDPNHYVCFVSLATQLRFATIKAIVKVQWLHDKKLFKEMRLASLRGNKLAVYYSDLEQYQDQLWQL